MKTASLKTAQQGIVLLVALIALVALSLSGIVLMRSVDTSNVISGNFAFNEATTQMAEVGINEAQSLIMGNAYSNTTSVENCNAWGPSLPGATPPVKAATAGVPITNPPTTLGKSQGCPHFYSTYFNEIDPATNLPPNFPINGWSPIIDVPNLPVGCKSGTAAPCDYTVQYFIERMCTQETWKWDINLAPAASAPTTWSPGAPTFRACVATPIYDAGKVVPNRGRLYYRVTVKVSGPRNTSSLVQYYLGQDDDVL